MTWQDLLKTWKGTVVQGDGEGLYLELKSGERLALSMDPRDDPATVEHQRLWEKSRPLYADYIAMRVHIRGYREGNTILAATVVDTE